SKPRTAGNHPGQTPPPAQAPTPPATAPASAHTGGINRDEATHQAVKSNENTGTKSAAKSGCGSITKVTGAKSQTEGVTYTSEGGLKLALGPNVKIKLDVNRIMATHKEKATMRDELSKFGAGGKPASHKPASHSRDAKSSVLSISPKSKQQ